MKKPLNLGMTDLDIGAPHIQTPAAANVVAAAPVKPTARAGGRPRTAPEGDTTRVSCVLDAATYEAVALYCIKYKINRQQFISDAIASKLGK